MPEGAEAVLGAGLSDPAPTLLLVAILHPVLIHPHADTAATAEAVLDEEAILQVEALTATDPMSGQAAVHHIAADTAIPILIIQADHHTDVIMIACQAKNIIMLH